MLSIGVYSLNVNDLKETGDLWKIPGHHAIMYHIMKL